MECRIFFSWGLCMAGSALFISPSLLADPGLALAVETATQRQDWSTVAETAIRWLEKEPENHALLGRIAEARLREDDLEASASWLARWEATTQNPTAPMLALRGELLLSQGDKAKAREAWEASYHQEPSPTVARRLGDADLWPASDRTAYEALMKRVADDYQFVSAMDITMEAALRKRQWDEIQTSIASLNEMGNQSAMSVASKFETLLKERPRLKVLDEAVTTEASGLAFARRADFFHSQHTLQLSEEDARQSLALAPRMVLPRITLALCLASRHEDEAVRSLRVVVQENLALIPADTRLLLDRLDHAASQHIVEPTIFLERALALASCQQPYLALDDLEAAGPALKDSAAGWTCRADCLRGQGRNADAKQAYDEALAQDPDHFPAWQGLALLAFHQADFQEAIRRFTWLSERAPKDQSIRQHLSQAKARLR